MSVTHSYEQRGEAAYLQCPHQGARNLMNADFPELKTTSSKLAGVSSMAADVLPTSIAISASIGAGSTRTRSQAFDSSGALHEAKARDHRTRQEAATMYAAHA